MLTNIRITEQFYGLGIYKYSCNYTGWRDLFQVDDFGNAVQYRMTNSLTALSN